MSNQIYKEVTDRIVASLDAGQVPWHAPYKRAKSGMPRNFVSKKAYNGINLLMLAFAPYACPYWLTFNQAKAKGGSVRKGEKSSPVVFWSFIDSKTERDKKGNPKRIPLLRRSAVFNLEQCEGIDIPAPVLPPEASAEEKRHDCSTANRVIKEMQNAPIILDNQDGTPRYTPLLDTVSMPALSDFSSENSYCLTLFHELAHSTGHESRLSRKGVTECKGILDKTGSYAEEELIAEISASFLGARCSLFPDIDNQAAYCRSWAKRLKEDDAKTWVIRSASAAQKVADYIFPQPQTETEEETE